MIQNIQVIQISRFSARKQVTASPLEDKHLWEKATEQKANEGHRVHKQGIKTQKWISLQEQGCKKVVE